MEEPEGRDKTMKPDKPALGRKKYSKSKSHPLENMWEEIFRTTQVPIFVEDITPIRQAIRDLKVSCPEEFGSWIEAHPEFVLSTVGNVNILDVNDSAVKMAGAKDKAHLMRSLDRMILPETLECFKDILKALAAGEKYYQGEAQYRSLDGRILYTLNSAELPQGETEGPDILVLTTHDITELKLSQKNLMNSEERYRILVETAKDIILCHDLNGRILFVNQAGLDLTGWSMNEMKGMDIHDLVPPRMHKEMDARIEKRGQGFGGTFLFEIYILDREGLEIPMEISTTRVPGEFLGSPQIITVMRNISERKAMEERIQNTHKIESLGALAGGIAHDFNNLLATIMGNTELLKSDNRMGDEFKGNLDSILEASNQAAELCQQMLAYSGKGHFSVDNGDLSAVIKDVSRLLQATVSGHARLNFQLAKGLPPVMIETAPIRQVIMGMVSNATEALGDEGGEVVIRTGRGEFTSEHLEARNCTPILEPGPYVYCEVADSGAGMEPDVQRRLFDPFYSTKVSGRGLGLSAAMGIVRGHGGGFLIESQPGLGSNVSFLLPEAPVKTIRRSRPLPRKAPDSLHLVLTGKLILLVDEDLPVRQVCESFLRRLGCNVLSVGNGPDAVRIFSQRYENIDLAILDLGMTDMDGVATFRRLRVIHSDIPVIFSSGYGEEELHVRAAGLGDYGFIRKPFQLSNVRQALALALAKSADI
jgi:two-component system, cell cycle sensor histidine kinase and response regulator CckA